MLCGSRIDGFVQPGMTFESAKEAIRMAGGKFLGDGFSTVAFSIYVEGFSMEVDWLRGYDASVPVPMHSIRREERCWRVSRNEKGMLATLECAMEHQDDPYAPKISKMVRLSCGGVACDMEILRTHEDEDERCNVIRHCEAVRRAQPLEEGYVAELRHILWERSPYVRGLHKVQGCRGLGWDLHSHNITIRPSDGHMVISDPLVE